MRAVVQRVSSAAVAVVDRETARGIATIGQGLLVFVGIEGADNREDVRYIASKVRGLRIFEDPADTSRHLNLSVIDISGAVLVVSQFTLLGDCRKGLRPSFDASERPERARTLYEEVVAELRMGQLEVHCGEFRANMRVSLVNEGPVTVLLDSRRRF
jgi:D-tyrosyl-tRNA(Tyr) deacylase